MTANGVSNNFNRQAPWNFPSIFPSTGSLRLAHLWNKIPTIDFRSICLPKFQGERISDIQGEGFQESIKITKQVLHVYLIDFPETSNSYIFHLFVRRTNDLHKVFEELRGDIYKRDDLLDSSELKKLFQSLMNYINSVQRMSEQRNFNLIHSFMCDFLLHFELDESCYKFEVVDNQKTLMVDPFKKLVDAYFAKLAIELQIPISQRTSSLEIWMETVKLKPDFYLHHLFVSGMGNDYRLRLLGLSECGCNDISHDRLLSDVRLKVESLVLDACQEVQISFPNKPVKILSLGSGKGLQDFTLVWKLLQAGIQDIELSLVELDYGHLLDPKEDIVRIWSPEWKEPDELPIEYYTSNQEELYNIVRAISLLSRVYSDAKLSVSLYPSMDHLLKEKGEFDVAYAIDFENYEYSERAKQAFHSIADVLTAEGRAILSQHYLIQTFTVKKDGDRELEQIENMAFEPIKPLKAGGYRYRHPFTSFTTLK